MSEDETFPDRHLAAAVASKCYYHLEEYDDAQRLALAAGRFFNIDEDSEYVHKIVSRCIDMYISQMRNDTGGGGGGAGADGDGDDADSDDAGASSPDKAAAAGDDEDDADEAVGDGDKAAEGAESAPREEKQQEQPQQEQQWPQAEAVVDAPVLAVVERMYAKCHAAGHFQQALGVAFEAQDLAKIEASLTAAGDSQR
jgi:hypothetical protein